LPPDTSQQVQRLKKSFCFYYIILTFQTKENKVLCRLVIMTEVSDSQLNISCSGSRK